MATITDDADNFYVELEDQDRWVFATVVIRKPCPFSALVQRAEACLTLSSVRRQLDQLGQRLISSKSPPSTKELKR